MKKHLPRLHKSFFAAQSHRVYYGMFFIVLAFLLIPYATDSSSRNDTEIGETIQVVVVDEVVVNPDGTLTFHGHNFTDPANVFLDGSPLNVTGQSADMIIADLPEGFDSTGNFLLTVETGEGMGNFDAYGLFLSIEEPGEVLNQLLIDYVSVFYDEDSNKSVLTVSGHNFDSGVWPPVVEVGGKSFSVDELYSNSNQIVASYTPMIDIDLTEKVVLVNPQADLVENYDAWIMPSEGPPPSSHWFEDYWKECPEGWVDNERNGGPYPLCFQLTQDYTFDLTDPFSDETWPYENLPWTPDPRTFPAPGPVYARSIVWHGILYYHSLVFMPPSLSGETIDLDAGSEKKFFSLKPGGILKLKKGFRWDGPTPPGEMKKPSDYQELLMRASLVHDTVYDLLRMKKLDRDTKIPIFANGFRNQLVADNSFYSICLEDGASRARCGGWWYGIRWGGVYKTHKDISEWKSHALADAGKDQVSGCGSSKGVVVELDGSRSRWAYTYEWTWPENSVEGVEEEAQKPTVNFAIGTHTVTLTVDLDPISDDLYSDYSSDTDEVTITVLPDLVPPVITGVSEPITIWPPNHKYKTFTIGDFVSSVSDNCTPLTPEDLMITRVTSDEHEDAKGTGHTENDIVISPDGKSVVLRIERQGKGDGRVYMLDIQAVDDNDNATTESFQVRVPHHRKRSDRIFPDPD